MTKKSINISELQAERKKFKPVLPDVFKKGVACISPVKGKTVRSLASVTDQSKLKEIFKNTYGLPKITFRKSRSVIVFKTPVKVAIVFSGGQAPGGHNVIAGLFDGLRENNKKNILIGYIGGPSGILKNKYKTISKEILKDYRNTGGFDFIQSGRTKIETPEQFSLLKNNLLANKVDALVIVGGDDSNTNAAMIAEYLKKKNLDKCVIGVPKTIDGDLKNKHVEISFGFDTATKIYSELVGNICRDVNSARKYWHFVRLMGRSASHITLEVSLKTQPNIVLIGEEILAKSMTLSKVVENITDVIVKRSYIGKNFGVILIPEGLIEFIPEMKELIVAINDILSVSIHDIAKLNSFEGKENFVLNKLPSKLYNLIKSLPANITSQFLLDRDPHGNVQLSFIDTEKLLLEMVHKELLKLGEAGEYKDKFLSVSHFFGYEGRCGIPSNFDANYTYALGYNASALLLNGFTGYLSSIKNLVKPPKQWECGGIPLTTMMNIEKRDGKDKFVVQKALVDLSGKPFKKFVENRDEWSMTESYISPGPMQYFGPKKIINMITKTLRYEHSKGFCE
ncbi:MAG: diphosphate--fructose-6-phosphate 1-phosphotransferase [Endomicrobium sp.]|jgi:pyrophosphate--fructose-6-phosphate 1-phosphotransferase|nr:diphosphate--fructose-6-phosphate 1-phosphotransferase [Endomicrobium sp.]